MSQASRKRRRVDEDDEVVDDDADIMPQSSPSPSLSVPPAKRAKTAASSAAASSQAAEDGEEVLDSQVRDLVDGIARHDRRKSAGRRPGSIVRMKLTNLMTYTEAEIFPGPQLNVVLGPNGTGKSSIVCGMVLGFGGKASFLARGKEIGDFVKKGTQKATIEIEVYGGEGSRNLVIFREIRKDNSSSWKLNGKQASQAAVKEAIDRLNVQVENLCSFLPQDRVSSFSELDGPSLLRETQLAIDGEELLNKHLALIELKKTEKNLEITVNETLKEEEHTAKQNQAVERDVIRFQEREKALEKVKQLQKKRPWLQFEAKRLDATACKKRLDEAKLELHVAESRLEPLKTRIDAQKKIVASCEADLAKKLQQIKTLDERRQNSFKSHDVLAERTEEYIAKRDTLERDEAERERNIDVAEKKLVKAREQLTACKEEFARESARLDELRQQQTTYRRELTDISMQIAEARSHVERISREYEHLEKQYRLFDQPAEMRLRELERSQPDVYRAHLWIKENRTRFKDHVYGPLPLELNVPNRDEARMLETALPDYFRLAFVVTNKDDNNVLYQMRTSFKLKIVIVQMDVDYLRGVDQSHKYSPQELRSFGLDKYLDESFEATDPDPQRREIFKKFVVDFATLNQIGVRLGRHDGFLYDRVPLTMFFSKDKIYNTVQSKYSEDVSIQVRTLPDRVKFFAGIDNTAKEQAKVNAEAKKREREAALRKVNDFGPMEQEKRRLVDECRVEIDRISQLERKVKGIESVVAKCEAEAKRARDVDLTRERQRVDAEMKKVLESRFKLVQQIHDATQKLLEVALTQSEIVVRKAGAKSMLAKLEQSMQQYEGEFRQLQNRVTQIEAEFNRMKAELRVLRDKAQAVAPLDEETKALFETFPATIDELDAMIEQLQHRANAIIPNPELIQRYEERKKHLEVLKRKFEKAQAELNKTKDKIAVISNQWLPRVEQITSEIDVKFQEFFENMGCKGSVRLHKEDNEDFDKYGVEILVSYRPGEPLQQLAASRQSGGEKSVATMLYLISLQQLSDCPFRLVDEINQGMDPKNERMIFEQVTRQASLPNTPQYFLITPKLLPELHFQPNCSVLCVMNGPWETPQSEMNRLNANLIKLNNVHNSAANRVR